MSLYLSFKEIWRNKGRFLLFSMVIALITLLVLFIAALAGGLSQANRQYMDNLDADLLVYQENADLLISASRLDNEKQASVTRVDGVADAGALGFSTATIVYPLSGEPIDVSLIGVEPGHPGSPPAMSGQPLLRSRSEEVLIDQYLADKLGVLPGDHIIIRTIQGTEEENYRLTIAGISEENQYQFLHSIFVPIQTWDQIRSKAEDASRTSRLIFNVIAVKLDNPQDVFVMTKKIQNEISGIEAADKETAIQAIPGYSVQQLTLNTQQFFTLLIGVLVLGGFFQIQTLQKIPQIGMLKAIGTSNRSVAGATLLQIITVSVFGVLLGTAGTLLISLGMPPEVPVVFSGRSILFAVAALLIIGPLGGLVSIRIALRVEPLRAIGL